MASLKRYKQPSENSVNRFDPPPRFKRQKSFTSKNPTMEPANHNSSPNHKNKKSTWGDSLTTSWSTTSHQKGSSFPREGRKIVKKLSTQKAQVNAENTLLKPPTQPFVLSPMENKLFSLTRNDECNNPDFAGTLNQNASNTDHMLGLHTLTSMTQQTVPATASFQANVHHQAHLNSNTWTRESPASKQFKSNKQPQMSPKSISEQQIDYSDPDIRTIEMLRELERVADQTDVGNDNSNDKSSLVSHHLRMLMCAVDRYTQGVDEDENDSCEDEGLPPEEIQRPRSQMPIKENSNFNLQENPEKNFSSPFSTSDFTFEQNPSCFPLNPATVHSPVANYFTFNMVDPWTPLNMENKVLDPWTPWSTPGFNGLDVYASPNIHNSSHMSDPSLFMIDHQNMSYSRDSCY